ncbi:MAG: hypothetical protein BJBARM5_0727 [Candidatus Parvarchaeum acidophilus ARMAN-5]|uniref:Uncharacterized protein n=1 Tax=Candidatus Parvarchaeum acidophilus ARMAN-5 TaxID=662762 RepID=D6GW53_PARA5|nr:MAG: hypothetical protein BJBARM5_0727 [Candidatus Parvarchaeum acidophilus ARMAN-5]
MDESIKKKSIENVRDYISKNNDFTIFYHFDTDGIVRAALMTEVLKKFKKGVYYYRATNYEDYEKMNIEEYSYNINSM